MIIGLSPSKESQDTKMNQDKIEIYYFYDVLCGWCYGFRPTMQEIHKKYHNQMDFKIISGGLRVDEPTPIGEIAPYIKQAKKVVEKQCGVTFGDAFVNGTLEEGSMVLNSLPPAIALSIVKDKKPDKAFEFGSLLQKAIFYDGMKPEDINTYGKYAIQIGLDSTSFVMDMKSSHYEKLAWQDIELTKQFGVSGFPNLIAINNKDTIIISEGYKDFKSIASILDGF